MSFLQALPHTQLVLAVSIFLGTFVYEDGATLLAATLSATGRLDPVVGLVAAFVGVWVGDMGLYGLGSGFRRRTARSRWLQKYLRPESITKAERWFANQGSLALVMSRAIPGSRLPLYLAAGALRFPFRLFAKTTALCSAFWVSAIFAIGRFVPKTTSSHQKFLPSVFIALVLFAPWLLSKSARSLARLLRKSDSAQDHAVGLCAH
jgi:membrane protein DedA with SNARE-associated domain